MERSIKKNGLINLLVLLLVGTAAFAAARYANSLAGQVTSLFLGLGILVSAVSWFQMRLEESERLEKLELDELAKSHGTSALFEAKDAEIFPAQRAREQFERYFVPVFTAVLCLLQAGGAWLLWRWLSQPATKVDLKQPITALSLFALCALVLFMLGRFSATYARLENQRLLRPGASYLLLNAFLCALVAFGFVGVQTDYPKADFYLAYVLCGLLALVSVETLIGLVLEVYRPRLKGKIERPLYDSRLVGLLGQPEGLVTTAAQALDYQFGFKVSETWFYRLFFEKALKWVLLAQALVLLLSTCFVFVDAGEQALLEHFGTPASGHTVLQPGAHLKWPWPIDQVYRFRTEQVQRFEVGVAPNAEKAREKENARVVVWTASHTGKEAEEDFLVANHDQFSLDATNAAGTKRVPPVSLVTGSIPVQFQITNLLAWAYQNDEPSDLLQHLARREVVRFLVSADMNDLMSHGRLEASFELGRRIQAAADSYHLGVKIVSVGLHDIHPPVKVAPAFENVVAAIHEKEAKALAARADEIKTNALAQVQATNLLNRASAERVTRELGAMAQAALFTNQIPAFQAAPSVYAQRAYLQTFARATAEARKFLILTTNTHDVLTFDLQESFTRDLSRITAPAPSKTK